MAIAGTSGITATAAGHGVTIQPMNPNWEVNLGSTTDLAPDTLELSDAELDRITAPTLRIGKTSAIDLTVSSPITSDGHYDTLSLRTGGAILDGVAGEATDITVNNLALRAGTGIGSADDLDVAVSTLAFNNTTSGNVAVSNAAGLTVGSVDGLTASSQLGLGFLQVNASGPLTVAAPIAGTATVELDTQDTPAAGDDITVLGGATIQSSTDFVFLEAGDNLTVQPGAILQSAQSVDLFVDQGGGDPGAGATASVSGTFITPAVRIFGDADPDVLIGSPGAEQLNGLDGADTMIGGAGDDTYFVDNAGDGVVENPGEGTDTVEASINYTLGPNVENLTLIVGGNLQGFGNGLPNTITGNAGNNLIDGRAGADAMIGGAGNDTYFVDNAGDAVFENANEGNDTVFASANFTQSAHVENLILQGSADLQGFGNGAVNVIYGNSGNNLLNGSAGADLMVGGLGNDTYFVDDSSDATFENPGEGNDAVFATAHYGLAADVETLVLQGIADLQGYGNNQPNTLYGNTANNLLNGAGGADTMLGGIGDDTYFVAHGFDQMVENVGEGTDAVFSTVNFILPANVETLVLQGAANANGTGNALANAIFGNSGDNMLDGQGNADTLTGGAGNDTFAFIAGQGNG